LGSDLANGAGHPPNTATGTESRPHESLLLVAGGEPARRSGIEIGSPKQPSLRRATVAAPLCSLGHMNSSRLVAAAVGGLVAALVPASASAAVIELGETSTKLVAPSCPRGVTPSNCRIVLTQVTALQTIRDGIAYPTTVKKAGVIVAFTVGLSKLETDRAKAKADIHFLDSTFGGTATAAITVLRSIGPKAKRQWIVTAESPVFHLQPYLGQVVQFPLTMPLPVKRGDVVALTVPTWAPVLTFNLSPARFAYRQSRSSNCTQPAASEQAQLMLSSTAAYGCNYPGTRVEYSATEITNPVKTKNYVHARDVISR
jgi:hypothetical protein